MGNFGSTEEPEKPKSEFEKKHNLEISKLDDFEIVRTPASFSSSTSAESLAKKAEFDATLEKILKPSETSHTTSTGESPNLAKEFDLTLNREETLMEMGNRESATEKQQTPCFTDDCTFLRIPKEYLNDEESSRRNELYKGFDAIKLNSDKSTAPNQKEVISSLEMVLFTVLQKLSENIFEYKLLFEDVQKNEFERIWKIISHNTDIFAVLKSMKNKNKVGLQKTVTGWQVQIDVNTLQFGKLLSRQREKEKDTPEEKRIEEGMEGKTQQSGGFCVVNMKTTELDTLMRPEEKKINHYTEKDTPEYSANVTETTEKLKRSKEIETISGSFPKRECAVPKFSKDLEGELAQLNTSKIITLSSLTTTQDNKKAEKEKKEFEAVIKMHAEFDKKERDEINKQLEEENRLLDIEIKRKREETHTLFEKMKEIEEMMEKERVERNEQREEEFRQKMEEQKRRHEQLLRKIREEREELERESERIHQENLTDLRAKNAVFWECVRLKLNWEAKENEWSDFLKRVRMSVARAKIQFIKSQDVLYACPVKNEFGKQVLEMELEYLQKKVLHAHAFLYKSFMRLKKLADAFPDKIFLLILLKNLKTVNDKAYVIAKQIDGARENTDNLEYLKELFGLLDSHEILQTWSLREISKTAKMGEYENIGDPLKYEEKVYSGVPKFEEVFESDKEESFENVENDEVSENEQSDGSETTGSHENIGAQQTV